MTKSHVALEQKQCEVCLCTFNPGIFIHKRLSQVLPQKIHTGMGLCEEHQERFEQGYLALVEIDPTKSDNTDKKLMKHEDAYRTGRICHVRKTAAAQMFNVDVKSLPMVFIEIDAFKMITGLPGEDDEGVGKELPVGV